MLVHSCRTLLGQETLYRKYFYLISFTLQHLQSATPSVSNTFTLQHLHVATSSVSNTFEEHNLNKRHLFAQRRLHSATSSIG
jgi:hypothetical protein